MKRNLAKKENPSILPTRNANAESIQDHTKEKGRNTRPSPNSLHYQRRHNEIRIHHPIDGVHSKWHYQILIQGSLSSMKKQIE